MFRVFLFLHVLSTQSYYCLTSRLFHLPVSIVRYIHCIMYAYRYSSYHTS